MLGLIGWGIAGAVGGAYGHIKSRDFVKRRLRFTSFIEKPGMGLVAGAATALVTVALPVVGLVPAILVGTGVGTGVAMGAKDARTGRLIEDD